MVRRLYGGHEPGRSDRMGVADPSCRTAATTSGQAGAAASRRHKAACASAVLVQQHGRAAVAAAGSGDGNGSGANRGGDGSGASAGIAAKGQCATVGASSARPRSGGSVLERPPPPVNISYPLLDV